jgi:hypothetical protein
MLKLAFAGLLALVVASCSTLNAGISTGTVPNVPPAAVYKLKASYDVVRAGFVVYRRLPWCDTNPAPCQTKSAAIQIKRADKAAMSALGGLEAVSRTGDTLSIGAAYAAAQQAVQIATQIAVSYHLK